MDSKEYVIRQTELATAALFRAARATREDKLRWRPNEGVRNVLELVAECAQSPDWIIHILETRTPLDLSPEAMMERRIARKAWKTLDEMEAVCRARSAKLYEAIRAFPSDDLESTVHLAFAGGREFAYWEMMGFQHWNLTYHLGQIAFLQTQYGDFENR